MLHIQDIHKTYPNGVRALAGINLDIQTGMFGLLGPNGAGKSTLMRTIATLQQADTGSITFADIDIVEHPMQLRQRLGYLPQEFGVYPKVSALRLLDYLARLKGLNQRRERHQVVERCLEITNLTDVRHKAVSSFSGGMRQRFGIAQLLLNNPKLIIVDEPTAGLDPAERQRFLNILREVSRDAVVIFSTHIVEDIKDLCQDMAILNHGKILVHAAPEMATKQLVGKIWQHHIQRDQLAEFQSRFQVLSAQFNRDHSLRLRLFADEQPLPAATTAIPNLEDVYFHHLNR